MPSRYECYADVRDGELLLPADISARLRAKGVERVRIVMTPAVDDMEEFGRRGIDAGTIERIAAAQGYESDVAATALRGEGGVTEGPLADRLLRLLRTDR